MPIIEINERSRAIAGGLLRELATHSNLPITDALNALLVAIIRVARRSDRPAEMLDNIISQIAQHPICDGRELPESVRKTVLGMLERMGAGN